MTKIMISVGEASGDLHGARLAQAIKQIDAEAAIFGMGGQAMKSAGVDVRFDIADIAVMGLVEVVKNLPRLFRLRDTLVAMAAAERPDVLVVIDYPDFNMRLAEKVEKLGIPVVYYISPQVWIWRRGRAKTIARMVRCVAAIFPFEAEVYRAAGAAVEFVGHPLLDIVKPSMDKQAAYAHFGADPARPLVVLMPGSRRQEIDKLLPVLLSAARGISRKLPNCQFFLPAASTIAYEDLAAEVRNAGVPIIITTDCVYDLMQIGDVALAASGTATLETSLMRLPTVIIYKVAPLTYFLGKLLVRIPYVGLPNIIAKRQVVPELLQDEAHADNIAAEALGILTSEQRHQAMMRDLDEVKERLGQPGAVMRTATLVMKIAGQAAGGHA